MLLRLSLLSMLVVSLAVLPGRAQEPVPDDAPEADASEEPAVPVDTDADDDVPAEEVAATESGDYESEEDEDDFVPTQDVSSDQSVRFPVDI